MFRDFSILLRSGLRRAGNGRTLLPSPYSNACQIKVTPELDGLVVRMPKSQH